jgi:hypothetical protein
MVVLESFARTRQSVMVDAAVRHVITTAAGDLLPLPRRWLVNPARRAGVGIAAHAPIRREGCVHGSCRERRSGGAASCRHRHD